MENLAMQEKQPQEWNLSLRSVQNPKAPDPRISQSAIEIRPLTEEYFPIVINIEEEIRLLKEDKKRASDEAKLKSIIYESDRLSDDYTDSCSEDNKSVVIPAQQKDIYANGYWEDNKSLAIPAQQRDDCTDSYSEDNKFLAIPAQQRDDYIDSYSEDNKSLLIPAQQKDDYANSYWEEDNKSLAVPAQQKDFYTDSYLKDNKSLVIPAQHKENIKPPTNIITNRKSILQEMKELSMSRTQNGQELGVTPLKYASTPAPKIQCSIDVSSYMRTPLNRAPLKIRAASTARRSDEDRCNGSPTMRVLFRKICVNDVDYIVLKVLGKGGSSCVYHCFDPKTETECAIKCVDLNQEQNAVTGFINEVKTLHRLQHCKRVIKMYAYQILKDEKKLYVVLEKGGEDLSTILKERMMTSEPLSMYTLTFYWMEMLHAVKEIHSNGVIHSDLKPANFLEASGKIKLIDFGISSCVQQDNTSVIKNVTLGTFSYISPEALRGDKSSNYDSPNYGKRKFRISYKSDVWSLGCILYQLVYKRTPFQHLTHTWAKLSTIMNPDHQIEYPPVDSMPAGVLQTIKDCLQYDAHSRPSIDDLISKYGQYHC